MTIINREYSILIEGGFGRGKGLRITATDKEDLILEVHVRDLDFESALLRWNFLNEQRKRNSCLKRCGCEESFGIVLDFTASWCKPCQARRLTGIVVVQAYKSQGVSFNARMFSGTQHYKGMQTEDLERDPDFEE